MPINYGYKRIKPKTFGSGVYLLTIVAFHILFTMLPALNNFMPDVKGDDANIIQINA